MTQMVMFQFFPVFNFRSFHRSLFKVSFFGNPYVLGSVMIALVAHLALLYMPFAQNLFETAPISLQTWGLILGVSVTIIIVSEIDKALLRRPAHQREAEGEHSQKKQVR